MANVSERGKHPVSAALAGPYGHPYHPILVTVPIRAWVASLVFDIALHVVGQPGFLTQASEWLIAIGVAGAIVAALAGPWTCWPSRSTGPRSAPRCCT
jgi:uncharacterized membrane protein